LRTHGILFADHDASIYEQVANRLAYFTAAEGGPLSALTHPGSLVAAIVPGETQRQEARIQRECDLERQLRALKAESYLLRDQLSHIARPSGVMVGVLSLVYFAAAGIVAPMVVMAQRPIPDGPAVRALMVLAFLSGLALLVTYLVWSIRRLRPPAD
jgi:hypothetical protein